MPHRQQHQSKASSTDFTASLYRSVLIEVRSLFLHLKSNGTADAVLFKVLSTVQVDELFTAVDGTALY